MAADTTAAQSVAASSARPAGGLRANTLPSDEYNRADKPAIQPVGEISDGTAGLALPPGGDFGACPPPGQIPACPQPHLTSPAIMPRHDARQALPSSARGADTDHDDTHSPIPEVDIEEDLERLRRYDSDPALVNAMLAAAEARESNMKSYLVVNNLVGLS